MGQAEAIPDTLLFPCARACDTSCLSSHVITENDVDYTALTLERRDGNTLSLRGEVSL